MRRLMHLTSLSVLAVCAATACGDDTTGPTGGHRALGALQMETTAGTKTGGSSPDSAVQWSVPPGERGNVITPPKVIVAPDTVRAGQAFTATVHTVGENACWRADGQEVTTSGNVAAIVPWDAHSGAEACAEVLGYLPHQAQVTFSQPGQGTIRVSGRLVRKGDRSWELPITAERSIVVR